MKSQLKQNYVHGHYATPVETHCELRITYTPEGEVREYVPVDTKALIASCGDASMWNLNNLLAAGINPNTGIHTGLNSRLEGIGALGDFEAVANDLLADTDNNNNKQND